MFLLRDVDRERYLALLAEKRAQLAGLLLDDEPCATGGDTACRDRLKLHANLHSGDNTLIIAFGTKNGKAWGLFAKLE